MPVLDETAAALDLKPRAALPALSACARTRHPRIVTPICNCSTGIRQVFALLVGDEGRARPLSLRDEVWRCLRTSSARRTPSGRTFVWSE